MIESWSIALGALFVAIVALGFTYLQIRHSVKSSYVTQLERRVENLEAQLTASLKLIESLRDENVDLMRRLFHATGGRREMPD